MPVRSAGLLLHRTSSAGREVLLVHPGGPYWANKDDGAWSIPKGELDGSDDALACARREFAEEVGIEPPEGAVIDLGEVRQAGGKVVQAFAVEGDLDVSAAVSNRFEMEWPPRSGVMRSFPEVDRVAWVPLGLARVKLLGGQVPLLDRLEAHLDST